MMVLRRLFGLAVAAMLVHGCSQNGSSSGNSSIGWNGCTIGAGLGAAAGAAGGWFLGGAGNKLLGKNSLGSTTAKGAGAVGGGLAGGLLGSQLGCALDAADQKRATDAVAVTTQTGRPQSWGGGESGASGQTQVVANDRNCRTVQQTVTLSDGDRRSEQVKSCRNGASWEVVSPS